MTTHVEVHSSPSPRTHTHEGAQGTPARFLAPLGRLLFAAIFLAASTNHLSNATIAYAASQGVPYPHLLVPLSGLLAFVGAVLVTLGFHARFGAWLLVLFLVPVTLMMHRFWGITDPGAMRLQQAMFMKNVSMLGATLLIAYFGAGPISFDARHPRRS